MSQSFQSPFLPGLNFGANHCFFYLRYFTDSPHFQVQTNREEKMNFGFSVILLVLSALSVTNGK